MKFELNVVHFDVADVVTTSGCKNPVLYPPNGNRVCSGAVSM